jgi:hypothetical protein
MTRAPPPKQTTTTAIMTSLLSLFNAFSPAIAASLSLDAVGSPFAANALLMLSTFSLPLTAAWSAAVVWTSEVTSLPDALRLEARMGFTDLIVTLEASTPPASAMAASNSFALSLIVFSSTVKNRINSMMTTSAAQDLAHPRLVTRLFKAWHSLGPDRTSTGGGVVVCGGVGGSGEVGVGRGEPVHTQHEALVVATLRSRRPVPICSRRLVVVFVEFVPFVTLTVVGVGVVLGVTGVDPVTHAQHCPLPDVTAGVGLGEGIVALVVLVVLVELTLSSRRLVLICSRRLEIVELVVFVPFVPFVVTVTVVGVTVGVFVPFVVTVTLVGVVLGVAVGVVLSGGGGGAAWVVKH